MNIDLVSDLTKKIQHTSNLYVGQEYGFPYQTNIHTGEQSF